MRPDAACQMARTCEKMRLIPKNTPYVTYVQLCTEVENAKSQDLGSLADIPGGDASVVHPKVSSF